MLSISIGPFALPVAPLLVLAALWLGYAIAVRLAARSTDAELPEAAGRAVFHAALAGLVVARLVHVSMLADAYAAEPWSILDLRDGGWYLPAGIVAGSAWLARQGHRSLALRRPLAIGAAVAMIFWLAATIVTQLGQARAMPTLPLVELNGGKTVTLADVVRGRPAVVNLWASWCGPCRAEMPVLAAAQQRESAIGFVFVNQGEAEGDVRAYLSENALQLRDVLLDAGATLLPAVGSRGLPTTLFYDAEGRLVDAHFGVLHAAALEGRLRELRAPK